MDISSCQDTISHSIVSVSENGVKAQFPNPERKDYTITRNDKCVMREPAKRVDFVITQCETGDLLIELKGSDISTALLQVETTVNFWREHGLFSGPRVAALIVCRQYPSSLASQKAITKFKKQFHNKKLTVDTKTRENVFSWYFLDREN